MKRILVLAALAGLFGELALAKDKESKRSEPSRSSRESSSSRSSSGSRSQPSSKPVTPPKAESPSRPAPSAKPAPTPRAESPKPPTTPNVESAPKPVAPSASGKSLPSAPSARTTRPKSDVLRPENPALPSEPSKSERDRSVDSASSALKGKAGSGSGPRAFPPPKISTSKNLPAAPSKKNDDHDHADRPATKNPATVGPVLPTAPKFETDRKIPAVGSELKGTFTPPATAKKDDHDHDHKPDRTPDRRPNDDRHDHGHSHSGHSHHHHRSTWIILGGAGPFVPRGFGYAPGWRYGYGYWSPFAPVVPVVTQVNPVVTSVNVAPSIGTAPRPMQMTMDEFAALPLARQRELLMQALNALEDEFARSPNGEDWSRHLQLATTAQLIGEGDVPPDPTTRARLRGVIDVFDEVAADEDLRAVSELWSFQALEMGLRELAAEPIDKLRFQLSRQATAFSKTLDTWENGQRWRDYLQLEWLIGTEAEMQLELPARQERFEKLLAKFDRVKDDSQFAIVSQSPQFRTTHAALTSFVRELQGFIQSVEAERQAQPEPEAKPLPPVPQVQS